VSSNRDFGVKQFFRVDEFRADDPSPNLVKLVFDKVEINLKDQTKTSPTLI
jgi:hypothetical protein